MNKTIYPDGALTRGDFSELLVRMAMFKSEDQPAADALDSLMQEYVCVYACMLCVWCVFVYCECLCVSVLRVGVFCLAAA